MKVSIIINIISVIRDPQVDINIIKGPFRNKINISSLNKLKNK